MSFFSFQFLSLSIHLSSQVLIEHEVRWTQCLPQPLPCLRGLHRSSSQQGRAPLARHGRQTSSQVPPEGRAGCRGLGLQTQELAVHPLKVCIARPEAPKALPFCK